MLHPGRIALLVVLALTGCRTEPGAVAGRTPGPGLHDHTPHHGGVVAMVGMLHLEAVASADGRLRLYLTDLYRRPLPLDGVDGTVTVRLRDRAPTLPLRRGAESLEAQGPPLAGEVIAAFAIVRDGTPIEANFMLPIPGGASAATSGAAGIPLDGCIAPPAAPPGTAVPRCTLSFARPVAAVAVVPRAPAGAALLVVAVVDQGMSAWRLPAGELAFGFAAPPAVVLTVPEPPHPEAPNALVARPGGDEIVAALENRLVVYSTGDGRLLRAFNGPGGIVRAVAWSPDGAALLVTTFYRAAAVRLDAGDGRILRQYPVTREGAAVAYTADGRRLAVGDETGAVALFAADADRPSHTLDGGRGPVRALAFAGEALIAGGDEGILRAWDVAHGTPRFALPLGSAIHQLAVTPDGRRAAAAGTSGAIAVVDLTDGSLETTLRAGEAQVLGIAWSGATLVSGDVAGRVALWDEEESPRRRGGAE